MMQQYTNFPKI